MGQEGKRYVSTTQAAKRLKSTPQTIRNRFRRGDLVGFESYNQRTGQTEIKIDEECLGPPNAETGRGTDIQEVRQEDVVRTYTEELLREFSEMMRERKEEAICEQRAMARSFEAAIAKNREAISEAIERQRSELLEEAQSCLGVNREILERQENILCALLHISEGLEKRRERRPWWKRVFSGE